MAIQHRLLKSAVLLTVAVLGSACGPGEIGAGGSPSDTSDGDPRTATSGDPHTATSAPSTTGDAGTDPGRPWAHNTGPSDPGALTSSGSLAITTDGAVLEDLDISGAVTIDADDVTIRNFRINATSWYGVRIEPGHSGIVLEDGEISGMDSAGILGVGFTARRLYIHDSEGDGIKAQGTGGPTLVEYCFIEKVGRKDDSHADGNQTVGASNVTFRYNNIYMPSPGTPNYPGDPYKSNATFMLEGTISDFVIENNWLNGGNYTIYCPDSGGVSVRDNIFGRDNGGWSQGKEALRVHSGACDEWSGNVWEDTGDPL